jgi:hypothetical protein
MKELASSACMIVIYALAAQAVFFALLLSFLYFRLGSTNRLLLTFQKNWDSAEADHKTLVDEAREKLTEFSTSAPQPKPFAITPKRGSLSSEIRSQVLALGKKGFTTADIARSSGLPESDIGVLLGLARIQK